MVVIGHQDIQEFFTSAIEREQLSHAYAFVGPTHVGKTTYARILAAQLLRVPVSQLHTHPDFYFLTQGKKKDGKTKKYIDVAQVRELTGVLTRHAAMGGYTVAIIEQAEKLNQQAANALLKTLEEPRSNTILILIAPDKSLLLPTIQSRSQAMYFRPVEKGQIINALVQIYGEDQERAEQLATYAKGRPGLAISWGQDEDVYGQYLQKRALFAEMVDVPFYKKIVQITPYFGDKTDHIAARTGLIDLLSIWESMLEDIVVQRVQDGEDGLRQHISPHQAVHIFNAIHKTKTLLQTNGHPRLAVEALLLTIP